MAITARTPAPGATIGSTDTVNFTWTADIGTTLSCNLATLTLYEAPGYPTGAATVVVASLLDQTGWTTVRTPNGTGLDVTLRPSAGWALGAQPYVDFRAVIQEVRSGGFLTLTDDTETVDFSVADPVTITTASPLPSGTVGDAYSETMAAVGGTTPYVWTVSNGSLPPGLSLSTGGAITGTPTTAGTWLFEITVTDDDSDVDALDYALTIASDTPWESTPLTAAEIAQAAADLPLLVAPNAASTRNQDAEWRTSLNLASGTDGTQTDTTIRQRTTRVHDGLADPPTIGPVSDEVALLFDLDGASMDVIAILGHNFHETEPDSVTVEIADDSAFALNLQTLAQWTGDWTRRLVETQLGAGFQVGNTDGARFSSVRYLRVVIEGGVTARSRIGEVFLGLRYSPPHRQDDEIDEQATESLIDIAEADSGQQQRVARWTGRLSASLRWRPDTTAYLSLFRDFFEAIRWGADSFLYIPTPETDERICYLTRTSPDLGIINDVALTHTTEIEIREQAPYVSKEQLGLLTLTQHTNLTADLSMAAPRLRRVVSIQVTDTEEHHFCDGEYGFNDGAGYWISASVGEVTPMSLSLDPFTREVSWGEMAVTFAADGVARQIISGNRVIGKAIRVRLGTERVTLASYVTEYRGTIQSYESSTNGEITLRCGDAVSYLDDLEITGGWISQHPVEIMRQILDAHVPAALWNPSGFDFESDTTRSHHSVSRYDARLTSTIAATDAVAAYSRAKDRESRLIVTPRKELVSDSLLETPRNAWELMQGLAVIAGGILRLDTSGRLEFARHNPAAATVAHWTRDVWLDAGTIDYRGTICNRVDIEASVRSGTSGSVFRESDSPQANDVTFPLSESTSQTEHAYPNSGVDRVFAEPLSNDWLRAVASLETSLGDDPMTDTTMTVHRASEVGCCGARYRYGFMGAAGGGIAIASSSITGNVLTMNVAAHWFETGAYITTTGLTANVTVPAALTVVSPTVLTIPLTSADDPTNGAGDIAPEQDPIDMLSSGAGRVAYFLLREDPDDPDAYEIVSATAGAATAGTTATNDPRGSGFAVPDGQFTHPDEYDYTIVRARFGTTARAFAGAGATAVFDITIAIAEAQRRLGRHLNGCPEFEVRTLLSEIATRLGDFVSLDRDDYVSEGYEGADEDVVWEVTSKEIDRDPPSIKWGLSRVRED
jgi:hypothetical protein